MSAHRSKVAGFVLDLFNFKCCASAPPGHLPQRTHSLPEHLIQEYLNHAYVYCLCPGAIGRRRAPGRALSSLDVLRLPARLHRARLLPVRASKKTMMSSVDSRQPRSRRQRLSR